MGHLRRDRRADAKPDDPIALTQDSPHAINSRAEGASIVQVQLGAEKWLMVSLWISAVISGMALAGMIAAMLFIRANIGYTAVLEYDLLDLRAKTGFAHENSAPVQTPDQTPGGSEQ